jgi:hypothetical protein
MSEGNGLAKVEEKTAVAVQSTGSVAFSDNWRMAQAFARSELVPKDLRGKPENCLVALMMAQRMGEDPLMVMQNIVIVHGTPGWKAQFLIARANRSGTFRDPIQFRVSGKDDDLVVAAYATMARTGVEVSAEVSMKMAKIEGWGKGGDKYKSMPQQMLSYRAASFLVRLYCPEVMLGMQSDVEVESQTFGDTTQASPAVSLLNASLSTRDTEVIDAETGEVTTEPKRTREPGEDDDQ